MDKYRANNNSHNLHYLCGNSEWGGRQNNHRGALRIPTHYFHGFTLGHANNVTLTINVKENTLNMRSHIGNFLLTFWYLQSAIIYNNSLNTPTMKKSKKQSLDVGSFKDRMSWTWSLVYRQTLSAATGQPSVFYAKAWYSNWLLKILQQCLISLLSLLSGPFLFHGCHPN